MNLTWLFSRRGKEPQRKAPPAPPRPQLARKAVAKPETREKDTADPNSLYRRPFEVMLNIGRYRMEPFTEGGICVVMRGIPLDEGKPKLAVKMVREQWLNHQAVRRQFTNESQIVRELTHPQLPRYKSRGIIEGKAYFAYEFIEGFQVINLSQQRQRFPPALVKRLAKGIIAQLLDQLASFHVGLKPVVHGDISSENILIDSQQRVFLMDFGCSHFVKQANREAYQWLAKPSFISPEQARGELWDQRSDLFQLGILFYELLRNRRWNEGRSKRDKVLFAASYSRQPDDFLIKDTDPDTSAFIAKLLDPIPDNRFQTAKEALEALQKLD